MSKRRLNFMKIWQAILLILVLPPCGYWLQRVWRKENLVDLNPRREPMGQPQGMDKRHGEIPGENPMETHGELPGVKKLGKLPIVIGTSAKAIAMGALAGISQAIRKASEDEVEAHMKRALHEVEEEERELMERGWVCFSCKDGIHSDCSGATPNPLEFQRVIPCHCSDPTCKRMRMREEDGSGMSGY